MITTDDVSVAKGDKVWRITGEEVEEGTISSSDASWTTVRWLSESDYHKSFESYSHQHGDIYAEIFSSESNAINMLIYRVMENTMKNNALVDKLENRLKEYE